MPELRPAVSSDGLDVELERWARQAIERGWLEPSALAVLDGLGDAGAGALFDDAERPLVVGLFGGTGVGKSSLLNRLARQDIARVSAERPTSRGVTAYLHRSRRLDALPSGFPLERLALAVHHEERWRDVLWVDMPDVDSVAREHREQVLQWLPHLDVVLYVASPERYRDERGWRLLLEHAHAHAWLFVLNQWDRGDAQQIDDWRRQLAEAGFQDPRLFRTVALPDTGDASDAQRIDDDWDELLETLTGLAERQLIDELEKRGTLSRVTGLLEAARTLDERAFGAPDAVTLPHAWEAFRADALDGLSGRLRARVPEVTAQALQPGAESRESSVGKTLFDATARTRTLEVLTRFAQEQNTAGRLPRALATGRLAPLFDAAVAGLPDQLDAAVGASLAQPGTAMQRTVHRALTLSTAVLPVLAAAWAGVRIVDAFRRGASDPAAYLGVDFAITAALLVALAWALPWWLARRSRPSREAALARGLMQGSESGLAGLDERISAALHELEAERDTLRGDLQAQLRVGTERLRPLTQRAADGSPNLAEALPEALRRLVPDSPLQR